MCAHMAGDKLCKPVLSICIPTFNRADLLEALLDNLQVECAQVIGLIEVVVSDNASTDQTQEVVRRCRLPIVYGRNKENIGFSGNLLNVTCNLASGEYVWVLGDDDVVLPGGVLRIIDSIKNAPDVSYHYVNFGWIGSQLRKRVVQIERPSMSDFSTDNLQCDLLEWRRLSRLEELVFLPSKNPSVLFSCIFSFVARRQFYLDAQQWLKPTNSLDGSSVHIDDCFPHAMLTLPRVAGEEVAYIGTPCVLQCVGGWEWGAYANKNMIFGIHQLFNWLEETPFAKDAMNRLWESYYDMAGRLFSRMKCYPDENKGVDIVMQKAIPDSASHDVFWAAFMSETQVCVETSYEANLLAKLLRAHLAGNPGSKIGLWGIQGRGYQFLRNVQDLHEGIVWVADKDRRFHGDKLEYSALHVSAPETIVDASLDCLVVATRRDFIGDVVGFVHQVLPNDIVIVSVEGLSNSELYHA